MNNINRNNSGMTLVEVSLAMMVMVIFLGVFSLISKYFQKYLKNNFGLDANNKSLVQNENTILKAMDKWAEILSQPSYSREEIKSMECSYAPNDGLNLWNLPGENETNLPKEYKYCIIPTSLGESDLKDLINNEQNAKAGIYFLYAIPDNISSTTKPIRRLMCRPINFC